MDAVLDRLIAAERQLVAALDADDIAAIEAAIPVFASTVDALRPIARTIAPASAVRVREALDIADAARIRVRCLADRNQQRLGLLAAASGRFDCTPATYSRG